MTEGGKRKAAPSDAQPPQHKKKKVGNAGKWKTAHQQAQTALSHDKSVQVGDSGIWVTCARRQEKKAIAELTALFEDYAKSMYGMSNAVDNQDNSDDDTVDIESAIKKEVDAFKAKKTRSPDDPFSAMRLNIDCLAFVKTTAPIEPIAFVKRICEDARLCSDPKKIKVRYVNRFSPSTLVGRSSASGIVETARQVLAPYFDLGGKGIKNKPENDRGDGATSETPREEVSKQASSGETEVAAETLPVSAQLSEVPQGGGTDEAPVGPEMPADLPEPCSFAIRPSLRNYTTLKSREVIELIASLINHERHKVNLASPDKVILIDVFQNVCGMSVVDGDWESLKKYNITELYNEATGRTKAA